jgi:hypothetical protein
MSDFAGKNADKNRGIVGSASASSRTKPLGSFGTGRCSKLDWTDSVNSSNAHQGLHYDHIANVCGEHSLIPHSFCNGVAVVTHSSSSA